MDATAPVGPGNRSFVIAKPAALSFSHHLEDLLSVRPSRPQTTENTWGRRSRKPRPEAPSAAPEGILPATRSCARSGALRQQPPERPGLLRTSASRWGLHAPIPPRPAIGAPRKCRASPRPDVRAHSRSPSPGPGDAPRVLSRPTLARPPNDVTPAPLWSPLPRTLSLPPPVALRASLKSPTRAFQPTRESRAPETRPHPQGPRLPVALSPRLRPTSPLARPPPTTTPA